jgi:hypothetical protein
MIIVIMINISNIMKGIIIIIIVIMINSIIVVISNTVDVVMIIIVGTDEMRTVDRSISAIGSSS